MRVLFLDVDGVLNRIAPDGFYIATIPCPGMVGPSIVELNMVNALEVAIKQLPDFRLVASSSWRKIYDDPESFSKAIHMQGNYFHEDWATVSLDNRGLEIQEWLHRHLEVTEYAVIDDMDDGIKTYHSNQFIRTDDTTGMTWNDLQNVLKIFGYRMTKNFKLASLGGPVESPLIL